ncbi:MAG: hypothetical protein EPN21_11870 [Methylococcaceae bacterium]|nr:MAG: hypothetical protein EPN21_11870 [Methylococcaceae bacterium]
MKNIRFRIWNANRMEFGGDGAPLQLHVRGNAALHGDAGAAAHSASLQDIMLATGIKDKDANEVYEGDICRGKISIACIIKEVDSGIVVYNPNNARFELKCSDSSLPLNLISGLQVIGHIHGEAHDVRLRR